MHRLRKCVVEGVRQFGPVEVEHLEYLNANLSV